MRYNVGTEQVVDDLKLLRRFFHDHAGENAAVFQDELVGFPDDPTDTTGKGSGNTSPDATGVDTDTASVRAERNGNPKTPGNGRVYHITFTADDGNFGTCTRTVTVCVPHDDSDPTCVNEGPLHDSTAL